MNYVSRHAIIKKSAPAYVREHTERILLSGWIGLFRNAALRLSGAGTAQGLLVSRQHDNAMEHAMTTTGQKPEPSADGNNIFHEADIGSGERSPGQQETDEMIKSIPPTGRQAADQDGSQQSGQPAKS
jgi:hypothetical protein